MFASKFTRCYDKVGVGVGVGEEVENKSIGHPVKMIGCAEPLVFSSAVCLGFMLSNSTGKRSVQPCPNPVKESIFTELTQASQRVDAGLLLDANVSEFSQQYKRKGQYRANEYTCK